MQTTQLVRRLAARLRESGAEPPSHLLVEEIWLAVVEGTLDVGTRLPTARQLAIALGVSPRSVERAYAELERRGVLGTRQGAGTFVSLAAVSDEDRARYQQLAELCTETVRRAAELGFGLDELLDALAEFRDADTAFRNTDTETTPTEEPPS